MHSKEISRITRQDIDLKSRDMQIINSLKSLHIELNIERDFLGNLTDCNKKWVVITRTVPEGVQ